MIFLKGELLLMQSLLASNRSRELTVECESLRSKCSLGLRFVSKFSFALLLSQPKSDTPKTRLEVTFFISGEQRNSLLRICLKLADLSRFIYYNYFDFIFLYYLKEFFYY